jgi:hypothetical protein
MYYEGGTNFLVHKSLSFTAPEKVYELRVVSDMNLELEVDWTPPLNTPRSIHRYRITYQVSSS